MAIRRADFDAVAADLLGGAVHRQVNAGHGINYENIRDILKIPHLAELNIGHSIISRASLVGLDAAVREMIALMRNPRKV